MEFYLVNILYAAQITYAKNDGKPCEDCSIPVQFSGQPEKLIKNKKNYAFRIRKIIEFKKQ